MRASLAVSVDADASVVARPSRTVTAGARVPGAGLALRAMNPRARPTVAVSAAMVVAWRSVRLASAGSVTATAAGSRGWVLMCAGSVASREGTADVASGNRSARLTGEGDVGIAGCAVSVVIVRNVGATLVIAAVAGAVAATGVGTVYRV
jgi:hypothetical protein